MKYIFSGAVLAIIGTAIIVVMEPLFVAGLELANTALAMAYQMSAVFCGGIFGLLLLVTGAGIFALQQENERENRKVTIVESDSATTREIAAFRSNLVYPNEGGMMPASMQDILAATIRQEILLLQSQQIEAQKTWAPVPNSFTYNYQPKAENYGGLLEDGQQEPQAFPVPSWDEIKMYGHIPLEGVSIGYNGGDRPDVVGHSDFGTALIVGRSGAGKTNLGRYLTAQMLFQNAKIYVADPEGGTPDDPDSESLADALAGAPIAGVATTPDEINSLCEYIAREAQVQGRDKRDRLVLLVDETNRLLRSSTTGDALTEAIYQTGAAGRKRGVFCWCFGQGASSKHIGTEIRDLFTSFVGFAGSQDLFGDAVRKDERDIMAELPKYHILHMPRLGGDLAIAAVPYVSNHDLEMFRTDDGGYAAPERLMLGAQPNVQNNVHSNVHDNVQGCHDPNVQTTHANIEPNIDTNIRTNIEPNIDNMTRQRVVQALRAGKNATAIARDIYGITKRGAASQEAAQEINEIIADAFLNSVTEEKYSSLDELGLMLLGAFQDGQTVNDVAETFGRRPSKAYMSALDGIYKTIREVIS